ncbi:diguanylate cyclase [Heyndrickxia sporothermodurans]|uniref:sensor domain-containing diguanylate cyclase n=1 Tax=Heyndrickxia sporothermodurans TaxID=46224 RepID=UPI002E22DE1D|nr:diguanylate cyclase [Heyndrickxia sporothermodurans]
MEICAQSFILYYKSRLFDLMEDKLEKRIANWITIIADCLDVTHAVYYKPQQDNNNRNCFEHSFSKQPFDFPKCISTNTLQAIFIESDYVGHDILSMHPQLSIFNSAFHLKYNEIEKGYLFLHANEDKLSEFVSPNVNSFIYESGKTIQIIEKQSDILNEEGRYKELFRVTEKFHSSMDVDIVLNEIIKALKKVFPYFTYNLLLSNDSKHDKTLPIKEFQLDHIDGAVMDSYVSGEIRIEKICTENHTILYAPLCGKQGVYGVLEVATSASFVFQNSEVEFIRLLANTGGSAFENAKLYEQSQTLIRDLQLINDTSHRLNSSTSLDETVQFLKSQIKKSFNTDDIGFVLLKDTEFTILNGSNSVFLSEVGKKCVEFIAENIRVKKEALLYSNIQNQLADETIPFSSLMVVPMIESDSLKGFCIVSHSIPYYFTFDMFKLFQSLIHHSTLAITNSMLREELERMVITDQLTQLFAKGFLNDEIKQSMEKDEEGTFILLDIDNFKKVNDTFGHQTGDEILVQVANIIQQNIRSSDIGARWGGEELAIYLPGASLKTGSQVAHRLVEAVYKNTKPKITVSCGVSYWNKKRSSGKPF